MAIPQPVLPGECPCRLRRIPVVACRVEELQVEVYAQGGPLMGMCDGIHSTLGKPLHTQVLWV